MHDILDLPNRIKVGPEMSFGGLTVTALLGSEEAVPPDYLTLDEALASGHARVVEVSEQGNVPELRFVNETNRPVLLLDGEELVGAKQNRVLNLTILAPAKAETKIPVSCVEAHRWRSRSATMQSSDRTMYARGRAAKVNQVSTAMMSGSRRSDQSAIWDDIARKSYRLSVHSETAAMADIYEDKRASIDDYVRHLKPGTGALGAAFSVEGRLIGLDLFDSPETYARLAPKLIRSYALDALDADLPPATPRSHGLPEWLTILSAASVKRFPAVGLGEDLRVTGDGLMGAALAHEGRLVHLCAFSH